MNGLNAGNNAPRNLAARRVVVAQVAAAVDKAEAVPVVLAVKVVVAQAARVVVVQVVREAKAEADVPVASVVRHRARHLVSKSRHRNKTPRLLEHGVCGSG